MIVLLLACKTLPVFHCQHLRQDADLHTCASCCCEQTGDEFTLRRSDLMGERSVLTTGKRKYVNSTKLEIFNILNIN